MNRLATFAATVLLASTLAAQPGHASSLALQWSHPFGMPHIMDDVPSTASVYGAVDHVISIFWLDYNSPSIPLSPGRYVARVRFRKTVDTLGRQPMTFSISDGGSTLATSELPASAQPVGQWVETHATIFEVTATTGPITARFGSTNGTLKRNYELDSCTIRPLPFVIPAATGMQFDNVGFINVEASSETESGQLWRASYPDALTYLNGWTPDYALPMGTYAVRFRLRFDPETTFHLGGNVVTATQDLWLRCTVGGVSTDVITAISGLQPVGQWFESSPAIFTVGLGQLCSFGLYNTGSDPKNGYSFDRAIVTPMDTGAVALVADRLPSIGSSLTLAPFAPNAPQQWMLTMLAASTTGGTALGDGRVFALPMDALVILSLDPSNGFFSGALAPTDLVGGSAKPVLTIPYEPALLGLTIYAGSALVSQNFTQILGLSAALPLTIQ